MNSVFLSTSFAAKDAPILKMAEELIRQKGHSIIKGDMGQRGSLSADILRHLRGSERVLVIMCKRFKLASGRIAPSPWLLEEKAIAAALGKPLVLLVEDAVDDQTIGGTTSGDRYVVLNRKNFSDKCADAMKMLLRQ